MTIRILAMAVPFCVATVLTAGASPVDSDTLVYLGGGGTSNGATAPGALTVSKVAGSFSQTAAVSAATLYDGLAGGGFTNASSLAVGGTKSCFKFSDPGETPYCHGSFTFECIFRTTSTQTDAPYIFRHNGGWMLQFSSDCSTIYLWYPGWTLRGQSKKVNDGAWHHLAVVQDITAGKVSFFVDYMLISQTDVDLGANPSSTDIFLGAYDGNANNSLLNSSYDEVRLTKRALAPREFLMDESVFASMSTRERRNDAVIDADTLAYVPFDSARFVSDENVARERNGSLPAVNLTMKAATAREAAGMPFYASPLAGAEAVDNAFALHASTNASGRSSGYMAMTNGLEYIRDDFTVEMFVRADSLSGLCVGDSVYVLDGTAFYLRWETDGTTRLCDGAWADVGRSQNIVDGQWHHLAAVWEQEKLTLSYYVDHRLVGSRVRSADLSGYAPTALYVNDGHWNPGASSYAYPAGDAHFDEFRLTRRALKASEFLSQRRYPLDADTLYYNSFDTQQLMGDVDLQLKSIRVGNYVSNGGRQETTNTPVAVTLHSSARDGVAFADAGALYMEKFANDQDGIGGGYILTNVPPSIAEQSFTFETFFKLDRAPTIQSYFLAYIGAGFVYVNTSGMLCASVKNFSQPLLGGGTNVVDGAWHHLAVVRDYAHGTVGVYLDYQRIGWLEGCASIVADGQTPSGDIYIGGYGTAGSGDAIYALFQSFTEVWMDELRITGRALKPTEFLALSALAEDPLLYARYEGSWAATSPGPYAVDGEPSGAAAFSATARVSHEIRDADGNALAGNASGLSLSGGVATYQANGALDAESATTEVFLKGRSASSAEANVIAFALRNDVSTPVWSLTAGGAFVVRTAAGSSTFDISSAVDVLDGGWHHFAVSYTPVGNDTAVKVWWDYANVVDETVSGAIDFSSAAGFVLGSSAFTGAMDELRMCAGVLDADDFLYVAPPNGMVIILR